MHYSQKTPMDSEKPELVAFFDEDDYQLVKDIFMYEEVPSLNKCLVENCEIDHKSISCMLISEADNDSESIMGTPETMTFMSDVLKIRVENDSGKHVMRKCGSENLMVDEDDSDARDGGVIDHCGEKIAPGRQLFGKVESRESESGEACSESETESRSIIHHSASSITTMNNEEEFEQDGNSEQLPKNKKTSKPQDEMSQSLTGPTKCSEQVPYSGSISYRSNSSSHSFAFPILDSEWNGSPIRMAKADRGRLRKQQRWRRCFLCYQF